jgi:ABC-type antimicrobial peptide transport system permease subunit
MWQYNIVSHDFLRVYGTRITKGRNFGPGETARSVILDEQTARFLWPGEDPIGKQLKFGSDARRDAGWLTVVGVSEYVNLWGSFDRNNQEERTAASLGAIWVLNSVDTGRVFRGLGPENEPKRSSLFIYVRGGDDAARLPGALKRGMLDESAGFHVGFTQQLYSALAVGVYKARSDFLAGLFTSFALIALALSSLGVYAVVSHTVSQRTREIGVRYALGATERDIRQSVLMHGNVMALGGIAVGLFIKGYTSNAFDWRSLSGDQWDFAMFGIAAVVLFATTLFAAYIPARRAMRVDPVEALRSE